MSSVPRAQHRFGGFWSRPSFYFPPLALTVLVACSIPAWAAPLQLAARPAARATAVSGVAPVLDPPSAMNVRAGLVADQALHASDADGDPLTFSRVFGPPYMTVTTIDPGAGSASGNVHLAPALRDAGATTGGIVASDGFSTAQRSFSIVVFAFLNQPQDVQLDEGITEDQALTVLEPGDAACTFSLVSGPNFVTVTTTSDSTGNVHLAPGFTDAGSYQVTVSVSDGASTDESSFRITVLQVNLPPVLAQPRDMHASPYTITDQILTASDPDGQALAFSKVAGPWYMSVSTLISSQPRGLVRLYGPGYNDTGTVVATVQASDGTAADRRSFTIRVDLDNEPPVLNLLNIDIAEGSDLEQTVVAFDPDCQRLSFSASNVPHFMGVAPQPQAIGSDSLVAVIRLLPNYDDAGTYLPTFRVSDGWDQITDTLIVTIRDAYPGENSLRLGRSQGQGSALDYEYSSVDGAYRASSLGVGHASIGFLATSGSGAKWAVEIATRDGSALVEGNYTVGGSGAATFSVTGSDSTLPGLVGCVQGSAQLQIRRIARRLDGSILSLWATFQQTCADATPGIYGEVRFQVQSIPITLVAPRWLITNANERIGFRTSAVGTTGDAIALSASGLPAGAKFVDFGGGQGAFAWDPTRDQIGDYLVRIIAASAGGLADTALTSIHVGSLNHAPLARANGPYTGTVGLPLPVTSRGSGDPDGDNLSYYWTFGDGTTQEGPEPVHIYRSSGFYPIALIVSDGALSAEDHALATVLEPDSTRAFEVPFDAHEGQKPIRLEAGTGRFCVAVEIVDAPLSALEVDRFSFRMEAKGMGGVDLISADPTTFVLGDVDGNGIFDASACFNREALRRLFDRVNGRLQVLTTVTVSLLNGRRFSAPLPLEVMGPDGSLRVLLAPNPFNSAGMFSFVTTRAGAARLTLFDARGRLVRTLLNTGSLPTGYHDIIIDARGAGPLLSSGVYFYRLETQEGTRTGRMAIVK